MVPLRNTIGLIRYNVYILKDPKNNSISITTRQCVDIL